MFIPNKKLESFVYDVSEQCFASRVDRTNRGVFYQNYFYSGSADQTNAALYNKVYALLDDTESLLYSPVSLRFHIGDPDTPNLLNQAKGRAASARLRSLGRRSDTDTMISAAIRIALCKGKGHIKQMWKGSGFAPELVQPEDFGVMRENHTKLDENMEAFSHAMLITPYQFARLVWSHPDRENLLKMAHNYQRESTGLPSTQNAAMQIVVGGLYPFQPAGVVPSGMRGMVDWMSQPQPQLSPQIAGQLMELRETWIWDDDRQDWATFQMVGPDMLIMGKYQKQNAIAWDSQTHQSNPKLKGRHPFCDFCINPVDNYYWGRSEISMLVGLQESLNARNIGINKMLRKQEDPTTTILGVAGINQEAWSRYQKPGGYFTDTNPNAKMTRDVTQIPQDIWASVHETERMMDELEGIPPIARGTNPAGVRSAAHANSLIRQFSPRFKDRALLAERDVEALGALMLDLAKAHEDRKMIAWVPAAAAGPEAPAIPNAEFFIPPAKGLVPIMFTFAGLDDDVSLTIDGHSSSPAFAEEAKGLDFDLLKVGAMSPSTLLDHVDAPDPEELQAEIERKQIAQAEAAAQENQLRLIQGSKHK